MQYDKLLDDLRALSNEKYKLFHAKLIKRSPDSILGVTVPILKRYVKESLSLVDVKDKGNTEAYLDQIFEFSNEYYEVVNFKLLTLAYIKLDLATLCKYLDKAVPLIDNWATCDSFSAAIKVKDADKDDFLQEIKKYLSVDGEFSQRFMLDCLFDKFIQPKYIMLIVQSISKANRNYYYVAMMCAWLLCELLVKYFAEGSEIMERFKANNSLDKFTFNKAIQKANESYRLSQSQKNYLKELKMQ